MKRPWLLTARGQRVSMVLAFLISLALIAGYFLFAGFTDRSLSNRQLDPKNIDYCVLENCEPIEKLAGLELIKTPSAFRLTENKWFTTVELRFINTGRLYGSRELRLVVRAANGNIVEMAKQIVEFPEKGPMSVQFTFTGSAKELTDAELSLGY